MINLTKSVLFLGFLMLLDAVFGQNSNAFEIPSTNPGSVIKQKLASTDVEVTYNRPSVKGRAIFGGLVPYDQVWRTGADASTKISFSTPIQINGQALDSGDYELFTIPSKLEWTIIFQKNGGQWGSYRYDPANDVLSVKVKAKTIKGVMESFSITFENVTSSTMEMIIAWSNVKVTVPIAVDLESTVLPQLEMALTQEGRRPYFRAAMFYFENDLNINRAAELMALALAQNPNHLGMLYRQALILEKKGDSNGAIAASELSLKLAQDAQSELKQEYTKLNRILLERLNKG